LFFRIEKNHPGIVFARDYASSDEIAINIMKSGTMQNLQLAQLPTVIPQKDLDAPTIVNILNHIWYNDFNVSNDVIFHFGIYEKHQDYIIKDKTLLFMNTITWTQTTHTHGMTLGRPNITT
jgi:hypothetical protein